MYFTREDILKILNALLQIGIKDSEFKTAQLPLLEEDTITIVLNGVNRKVKISNIIGQFNILNRQDFINVSDMYDEHYITINEAIKLMPLRKRKEGLVITFQNTSGKWQIYQFKGTIDLFVNPIYWEDLFGLEYPIINSIIPDEEDLTMSKPDEDGNSLLSFKDKNYDPEGFSGMATRILRKNIVEVNGIKKNILTQDIFDLENCIYEIKYNFDLDGLTIISPKNCILKFNGGSLCNGTLDLNNVIISAEDGVCIFKQSLEVIGHTNTRLIYVDWFDVKGDGVTDDSDAIIKCFKSVYYYTNGNPGFDFRNKDTYIYFSAKKYILNKSIYLPLCTSIIGRSALIICTENNFDTFRYDDTDIGFMIYCNINEDRNDPDFQYPSVSEHKICDLHIETEVKNVGFLCNYGNPRLENLHFRNFAPIYYAPAGINKVSYIDNFQMNNISINFYYYPSGLPFEINFPVIRINSRGDIVNFNNIRSSHNATMFIQFPMELHIRNSFSIVGEFYDCANISIENCHFETTNSIKLYYSNACIRNCTFLYRDKVIPIKYIDRSDYNGKEHKLEVNNCMFLSFFSEEDAPEAEIETSLTTIDNIILKNNIRKCSVRGKAYNFKTPTTGIKIKYNNNFYYERSSYNKDENGFVIVPTITAYSNVTESNNTNLYVGDITYSIAYVLMSPNHKLGGLYSVNVTTSVTTTNSNNDVWILLDNNIKYNIVIIEKTFGSITKHAILPYSVDGFFLDTGNYINGYPWLDSQSWPTVPLPEGSTYQYQGGLYTIATSSIKNHTSLSVNDTYKLIDINNPLSLPNKGKYIEACGIYRMTIDANKYYLIADITNIENYTGYYISIITQDTIINININVELQVSLKYKVTNNANRKILLYYDADSKGIYCTSSLYDRVNIIYSDFILVPKLDFAGRILETALPESAQLISLSIDNVGISASRPTNIVIGYQFYDSTLKKPIWWNGTNWIDATGQTV